MKTRIIVILIVLWLSISACGPSESQIKTAVAQTLTSSTASAPAPTVTSTPTLTPLPTLTPTLTASPTPITYQVVLEVTTDYSGLAVACGMNVHYLDTCIPLKISWDVNGNINSCAVTDPWYTDTKEQNKLNCGFNPETDSKRIEVTATEGDSYSIELEILVPDAWAICKIYQDGKTISESKVEVGTGKCQVVVSADN